MGVTLTTASLVIIIIPMLSYLIMLLLSCSDCDWSGVGGVLCEDNSDFTDVSHRATSQSQASIEVT